MSFREDDFLQLSGLQHFAFCRRQWALIHLEQQWRDNARTVEGDILHERAHDERAVERRGDTIVMRGLRIASAELGISGACDVVEFHRDRDGAKLSGEEGSWRPYPVEYKRGVTKIGDEDRLQLCAQAMCLEEMLGCSVPEGALYYGETRRRERVPLGPELREQVRRMLEEMHDYHRRGHTPKVKPGKHCNACSLKEICLPALCRDLSATAYIRSRMKEELP
ncbi:MAG: CRISPR-associated protein Cas4 [Oscillospiraceae bacterium]|nr:CRISPR-associated protein Cas4 [Oscillospiraceae bacterium]